MTYRPGERVLSTTRGASQEARQVAPRTLREQVNPVGLSALKSLGVSEQELDRQAKPYPSTRTIQVGGVGNWRDPLRLPNQRTAPALDSDEELNRRLAAFDKAEAAAKRTKTPEPTLDVTGYQSLSNTRDQQRFQQDFRRLQQQVRQFVERTGSNIVPLIVNALGPDGKKRVLRIAATVGMGAAVLFTGSVLAGCDYGQLPPPYGPGGAGGGETSTSQVTPGGTTTPDATAEQQAVNSAQRVLDAWSGKTSDSQLTSSERNTETYLGMILSNPSYNKILTKPISSSNFWAGVPSVILGTVNAPNSEYMVVAYFHPDQVKAAQGTTQHPKPYLMVVQYGAGGKIHESSASFYANGAGYHDVALTDLENDSNFAEGQPIYLGLSATNTPASFSGSPSLMAQEQVYQWLSGKESQQRPSTVTQDPTALSQGNAVPSLLISSLLS